MNKLARFVARDELDRKKNLESYIRFQRENMPACVGPWEKDIWDTTEATRKFNRSKNGSHLYFRSWEERKANRSKTLKTPIQSPFKEFAKAYVAEVIRERQVKELTRVLVSLQVLSTATQSLHGEACITRVDGYALNHAAGLLREHFQAGHIWNYGRALEQLSNRIKEAGLTKWKLPWKQPFKYLAPQRNDQINKRIDKQTNERLPDIDAVLALADIYHRSDHDHDKIPTSFASIAMIAPERAGEILTLPVDCKTSMDRSGHASFGIRWKPLKGGQAKTNWVISAEGAEVAEETVDYLIARGEKARAAAKWYAEHPDNLYLPPSLEYLRAYGDITLWEASQIIGRSSTPKPCHKEKRFGFTIATGNICGSNMEGRAPPPKSDQTRRKYLKVYAFSELEQFILSKLPKNFPVINPSTGLKYHEALWCLPAFILRSDADTLEYVPDLISIEQINHHLGLNPNGRTVFTRNEKLDSNGKPYKITTHQFRHLLNTLAQSKYVSQELIAFWSGRKQVSQNGWYNHIPQQAFIEAYIKIDAGLPELKINGPLEEKINTISHANLITRKEAISYELGATHKTRYGICRHDYALTNCPKDKDCISCGEHVFVKGDLAQITEAQEQVALFSKGLRQAEAALAEGRYGAQRWIDLHKPKLDRWRLALKLLTNPETIDGTLITMPKPEISQSKTGLAHAIRSSDVANSLQTKEML